MHDEVISIKGTQDGLLIELDAAAQWLAVTSELASRIDARIDFFAGAKVTIDLGERPVPKHDMTGLKALLERRRLILSVVVSESATTLEAATALDIRTNTNLKTMTPELQDALPIASEEEGTLGTLIKRTLRSGRTVKHQGHVVVIGDVNPGAEIIAGGDVIVWGKLRGNVHAGAYGDDSAHVCALDMSPTQLRIAGFITTSPKEKRRKVQPETALIRDSQIIVEAWKH